VRVRTPANALHTLPLFRDPGLLSAQYPGAAGPTMADAADYPRTVEFLADLIEFDTRDPYQDSPSAIGRYEGAFELVASTLSPAAC
jgi:hypothetical protein